MDWAPFRCKVTVPVPNHPTDSTSSIARERTTSRPKTYHVYHDPDSPAQLSTTVAHALANAMADDVTDTEFRLYDCIDPDALDNIFAPTADGASRAFGHVAFKIKGYQVTVYDQGQIVITTPPSHRA